MSVNSRDYLETESVGPWQWMACVHGEVKKSPRHLDSGLCSAEVGRKENEMQFC